MSVLMWIISGIGVLTLLVIAAFFIAVFRDMGKELKIERKHAKAVLDHSKSALTGDFKDNYITPKLMMWDRSTIPYVDEGAYGTDDHYLLALAAPLNAQRCKSAQTVGGYFDRVKILDPAHGPLSEDDKEALRVHIVDFERIANAGELNDTLEHGLLNEMNFEVSQVLALNNHTAVPADMIEYYEKGTTDSYQRGIEKFDKTNGPLDLRSYRLMTLIHYARIGATLEWIPENEAWDHIRRIGFELRARVCRYASWEDYGAMILRCHKYLGTDAHVSKRFEKQIKLLHREKWSPWQKLEIHHSESQKQFSEIVPPLELIMPETGASNADFPELSEGRYLEAGDRLIAATDCTEIGRLASANTLLQVPQETLDDLVSANPDHAGIHLLAGQHAIQAGFKARGSNTANWVSDEAFATLADRAQRACDLAQRGFELAPDHHGFTDLVISASDHTQSDTRDLSQKAFELAGTKHLDDLALQMRLMRPLLEKWGGSADASFQMAQDRMARSSNPMAGLLFLYAAVEFVGLGSACGGSDDRHKNYGLRQDVHKIAAELLNQSDPENLQRVRSWFVYWAYSVGDRSALMQIGPFDGHFHFDLIPWIYIGEGKARVILALLADIAATVGHKDWLALTGFYEDASVPSGPLQ